MGQCEAMDGVTPKPLWMHFLMNTAYALVVGGLMVAMGDLRVHWWLLGALLFGLIGIPITRRWERRPRKS